MPGLWKNRNVFNTKTGTVTRQTHGGEERFRVEFDCLPGEYWYIPSRDACFDIADMMDDFVDAMSDGYFNRGGRS